MRRKPSWSLGAKLAVVGTPFLLLALVSIAFTLWVSWQLDGGAGAVNEAGRMRMQAYRLALAVGAGDRDTVRPLVAELDHSLQVLRDGDAERPLFVPWDDEVKARFGVVEREWRNFRDRLVLDPATPARSLQDGTSAFTGHIDALVAAIETHLSVWTALLHLFQTAMMVFAVVGGAVLLYTGYRFVLEPVG